MKGAQRLFVGEGWYLAPIFPTPLGDIPYFFYQWAVFSPWNDEYWFNLIEINIYCYIIEICEIQISRIFCHHCLIGKNFPDGRHLEISFLYIWIYHSEQGCTKLSAASSLTDIFFNFYRLSIFIQNLRRPGRSVKFRYDNYKKKILL